MKTKTLGKAFHLVLLCVALTLTFIFTKNALRNIKNLYGSEKGTQTVMTCINDLIY
jgi:hypothetical protein